MVSLSLVGSVSGIHGDVGDLAKEFQTEGRQCHMLALELVRIGLACFYQGAMGAKRMSRSIKVPKGSTKPLAECN